MTSIVTELFRYITAKNDFDPYLELDDLLKLRKYVNKEIKLGKAEEEYIKKKTESEYLPLFEGIE